MFKKILSNLPFSPGLINQISFYSKRLRQEAVLRRAGFLLMSLALTVQVIAVLSPPQKSLAASPNDVLDGISNKSSILRAWDNNTGNIRGIYEKFGITRNSIANISGESPNATINSIGRDYWSTGRLPLTAFGISSSKWAERTINANGSTVYERPLHAWDTHGSSNYKAFHGYNAHGKDFWILQTCGNPTFVGAYLPAPFPTPPAPKLPPTSVTPPHPSPPPSVAPQPHSNPPPAAPQSPTPLPPPAPTPPPVTPEVKLTKSVKNLTQNVNDANGTTVKNNDTLEFKLMTQNITAAAYLNYQGQDYFGSVLQYADIIESSQLTAQGVTLDSQNYLRWKVDRIGGRATDIKTIKVRVKQIIPATNTPSKLSPDYNCKLSNEYGTQIVMNVDCPIVKVLAENAAALPNTGPGTSLTIGATIAAIAGYFFARSRIMNRELEFIRSEYSNGGGI